MITFKKGEWVKIIHPENEHVGKSGTIARVYAARDGSGFRYDIDVAYSNVRINDVPEDWIKYL